MTFWQTKKIHKMGHSITTGGGGEGALESPRWVKRQKVDLCPLEEAGGQNWRKFIPSSCSMVQSDLDIYYVIYPMYITLLIDV